MTASIASAGSKRAEPMDKNMTAHNECAKHADAALAMSEERVTVTAEDSRRICRKTDIHILLFLSWVSDKIIVGLSAVFGLKKQVGLVGNQYSNIGNIGYYAQLVMQPLAAYLLVKVPLRRFVPLIIFLWGVSLAGMAASKTYRAMLETRFFLGVFEAAVLPAFMMITSAFYRRSEQPVRVAIWYGSNGLATMVSSAVVYGIGHIRSSALYTYRLAFLIFAIITLVTAPLFYWRMDDSPVKARFLTPHERLQAVERLRANQTGVASSEFKLAQIKELILQPSFWIFMSCTFCVNVGTSVSSVFGALILQGLVGLSSYQSVILNVPFGTIQTIIIVLASWLAYRFKVKSIIMGVFMVPVVVGVAILYAVPHDKAHRSTKKAAIFTAYNAASPIGNIAGPYIFQSKDAPDYYPGLEGALAVFSILIGLITLQGFNFAWLNRKKAMQRAANGQTSVIVDTSMNSKFEQVEAGFENAFLDMTDRENPDFFYVL
ncbi:hypothetical protein MVLG_03098 [Microbotryum lychnidis-dioicae p1A1 Lamole]|uniref:Major facilitator superfamily (MFS) profile domain-containing protein n=1 Tax=Microbotryum lychnidis-dioicae (strain p1A1 Lamole / MvSl-1064) TaxID=683840 RepID=U5H759_USTV1|nr:hypothetical protein MVLG_03098 [Microbotryum lychnidis-dioicae p1A1 Lamole]|eukprot:KDE06602.1 hypothetical protein MVLG_03098 [Microbotryum lychnidis-dioicae p1A1 Lamole]